MARMHLLAAAVQSAACSERCVAAQGRWRPQKVCRAHQDVALRAHYEPAGGAIGALQVSLVQVAGSRQQLSQGLQS